MNRKSTRHTTFFSVISIFMMIVSLITPTQIHALDTFVDMTYDETSPLSNKVAIVNGAIWTRIDVNDPDNTAAGTGVFDAFLQIQKNGEEKGYNSDLASPYFDAKKANTHSMLLKDVPIIAVDGGLYYEFHMDINENDRFLVTNRLQIWTTDVKSLTNPVFDAASGGLSFPDHEVFKAYDTEGSIIMLYYHNGSGKPEYKVWVPVSNFVQKTYVVLYAYHGADNPAIPETYRVGNSYDASDGFEEWGIKIYPEIPPSLVVTKTALTLEVNEPGEFVTYKVDLTNTSSPVDTLTITTLTDAIEGGTPFDISGMIFDDSALLMPTVFPFDIAPNMTKTVYFKAEVRGEPRDVRNIVYARGYDEENTMAEDDDDAIVKINDVLPTILLNKTADPKSMLEPGGTFNFEFVITNTSVEDIWLTKVEDDILGVLYQWEEGMTKIWIGAGAAYTLPGAYSKLYTEAGVYPNVAVAYAEDNEGNKTNATDRDSVEVIDVLPTMRIEKTAAPLSMDEPGGTFTYTFKIFNTSVEPLWLTEVVDDVLGTLYKWTSGDKIWIAAGGSYDLPGSFTKMYTDAGSYKNIVMAYGEDNEGNKTNATDDATVVVNDVKPTMRIEKTAAPLSMDEPGGTFTYTFKIFNTSVEPLWLTEVVDDVLGTLYKWTSGDKIWIAAGGSYDLPGSFTKIYTDAGSYKNIVMAYGEDNEGNKTNATDDATVVVNDVLPTMRIEKTATPLSMDEPGGTFTYTFKIFNTSVEPLWLTEVVDDVLGTLYKWTSGDKIWIAAGGSYDLPGSFTKMYTDAGSYKNIVVAYGEDNEGNKTNATDDATVVINDVLPTIEVTKTANRTSIPYTSVMVDFTFVIYNRSVEKVIVTSIMDDVFGNLFPEAFEQNMYEPIIIDVAGSYTFTVSRMISGTAGGSHVNVVTVEAQDNEGNTATDWDDETITFYWMGFTPGYWKNHLSDWVKTAYTPIMLVTDVFNITHPNVLTKGILDLDGNKKPDTLLDALNYKGGGNIKGKVQILMRAAVAALLNESALGDMFPPYDTVEDLIKHVEDTVNSGDIQAIGALATLLDAYNNGEHIFYPY